MDLVAYRTGHRLIDVLVLRGIFSGKALNARSGPGAAIQKERHPTALPAEKLALLLILGLLDLALGEALIKNVEGGATPAGTTATRAPAMAMVEAVAIKRVATGRPAHQPHEDHHHANDGEHHEDGADYHEGMPAPSRPAPHVTIVVISIAVLLGGGGRRRLPLLGKCWQCRDGEDE